MSFRLTRSLNLGLAYAGLTLYAQLKDPAGATVGAAVTTGFVELLDGATPTGSYIWDYAAYPDAFRGIVEIRNDADDALLAAFDVNPEEVNVTGAGALTAAERNAIADAILARNIGGGSSAGRTVTSALRWIRNKRVEVNGVVSIYREDDSTLDSTATVGREPKNPATSVDPA